MMSLPAASSSLPTLPGAATGDSAPNSPTSSPTVSRWADNPRFELPPLERGRAATQRRSSLSPVTSPVQPRRAGSNVALVKLNFARNGIMGRRKSAGDLPGLPLSGAGVVLPATGGLPAPSAAALVGYHSKYDPKEVLVLREFFLNLEEDARLLKGKPSHTVLDEIRANELKHSSANRLLAARIFDDTIGKAGLAERFRDLLAVIHPNATDRDYKSMLKLAFPDLDTESESPPGTPPSPDHTPVSAPTTAEYEKAFDELDPFGAGHVPLSRLRPMLARAGLDIPSMWRQFDPTCSGIVSRADYVLTMVQINQLQPMDVPPT